MPIYQAIYILTIHQFSMVTCCFVNARGREIFPLPAIAGSSTISSAVLSHLFVYPVKSCGAIAPSSWMLGTNGLIFDRRWMLTSADGTPFTQKRFPAMCFIRPEACLYTVSDFEFSCYPLFRPPDRLRIREITSMEYV